MDGLSERPAEYENGVDWLDLVLDLLETLTVLAIPKEAGRAEADFGRFDARTVVRNVYILFSRSEIPLAREDQEIMDMVDHETPLPPWFSEDDLAAYAALYEKSGFGFPLQMPYMYGNLSLNVKESLSTTCKNCNAFWNVSYRASYAEYDTTNAKIEVPSLLIIGGKDYFLKFPMVMHYIESEELKENVPDLEVRIITEGTHFMQEQCPDEVNQFIIGFLGKHRKL